MTDADVDPHRFEVKTRLTAEEVVAFQYLADSKGLSGASLIRMLIKESIAAHCAEQLTPAVEPKRDVPGLANVQTFDFRIGNR